MDFRGFMTKDDLFQIGVITDTHGLKGEVKVFPLTDDVRRFDVLKDTVLITPGGERIDLVAERARYFKNLVILKFKDYDDINDIEKFKKSELYVTRENAIPLEEGEYYLKDLYGLQVHTDEGEDLGVIDDIIETGANDVYVVKGNGREILIPNIRQCVLNVDLEAGLMEVHLLDGLMDL